ncbi:hypothetical protein, partial [Nocardia farcinica]|uniref:hypothetical protein n=1 Tax=Nocardia farcinica TaxID=37329 RepID=UPI002458E782
MGLDPTPRKETEPRPKRAARAQDLIQRLRELAAQDDPDVEAVIAELTGTLPDEQPGDAERL